MVCDIPLGPLADDAPEYDRPHLSLDEYKAWAQVKPLGDVPESTDIAADLLKLMASPNLASRRWIWEQYDQPGRRRHRPAPRRRRRGGPRPRHRKRRWR